MEIAFFSKQILYVGENCFLGNRIKMVVKVYGSMRAACPQRVLACLLEKEVDFDIIHIDLDAGEHKRPDFLVRQVVNNVV